MSYTVPNQRAVVVHREKAHSDFLGINNSNWQAAARDLNAHALLLYLYLASNANGFCLALSPNALRQAVGMPPSTYRDQFLKLIDKGYLVQRAESNVYDFYEIAQRAPCVSKTEPALMATANVNTQTPENIEININTINNKKGVEKQVSPRPIETEFIF